MSNELFETTPEKQPKGIVERILSTVGSHQAVRLLIDSSVDAIEQGQDGVLVEDEGLIFTISKESVSARIVGGDGSPISIPLPQFEAILASLEPDSPQVN